MKKFKAFTLIETLIVIVIFCIWILTVLIWLSQTIRNKEHANTQIKSAFFAREWIELIFNLRDANYHKELPWNCIFKPITIDPNKVYDEDKNPFCEDVLKPWKILKISMWSDDKYLNTEYLETSSLSDDFETNLEKFQIYFHTWTNNWFSYDYVWNEDEETWFARYIEIKGIDIWWGNVDDKLLKVESHVLYKRWDLTWEKVMETFIGNYEFNQ